MARPQRFVRRPSERSLPERNARLIDTTRSVAAGHRCPEGEGGVEANGRLWGVPGAAGDRRIKVGDPDLRPGLRRRPLLMIKQDIRIITRRVSPVPDS